MSLPVEIILLLLVALLFAGLAVRRARARAERRARNLRALFEVSRRATANLDQQQVLEVAVQAVQDVMGYRMASVALLVEKSRYLVEVSAAVWAVHNGS